MAVNYKPYCQTLAGFTSVAPPAIPFSVPKAKNSRFFKVCSLHPGQQISLPEVLFTRQHYSRFHAIAWWFERVSRADLPGHKPGTDGRSLPLVCQIHKSHLSSPSRICRLMIASCLAYVWDDLLGFRHAKDWHR